MKRFIEGESREQVTLLPECLDDYIGQDNPVRVVDAFVEELDLRSLGFQGADPAATGRPAYHPSVLLKLYIYGYLNRIQSSRRLEREAQRNVELMWLTGRLAPDFKTIADFRHHNSAGIRNVCKRFIGLCRDLKLFSQAIVAIEGSKFKAVNSRDANFTPGKVDARQRQIEQSIQRYLDALETADRTQPSEVEAKTERLTDKIRKLREQMRQLDETREQLKNEPDGQRSTTDPDARSMNSQAKGAGMVGYNVQTAVDAKHQLLRQVLPWDARTQYEDDAVECLLVAQTGPPALGRRCHHRQQWRELFIQRRADFLVLVSSHAQPNAERRSADDTVLLAALNAPFARPAAFIGARASLDRAVCEPHARISRSRLAPLQAAGHGAVLCIRRGKLGQRSTHRIGNGARRERRARPSNLLLTSRPASHSA